LRTFAAIWKTIDVMDDAVFQVRPGLCHQMVKYRAYRCFLLIRQLGRARRILRHGKPDAPKRHADRNGENTLDFQSVILLR
jgi:hypothetical protein